MEKQCKKCLKTRPIDDFYKHPRMADGHLSKCKECARADVIENRNSNLDYYRNYDRERYDKNESRRIRARNKEAARIAEVKRASSHGEERKARRTVGNAVRGGRLVRPKVCSRCRESDKIEAHHEDYSKPLEVTWLCKKCHAKTWTKERKDLPARKRGGYKGSMLPTRASSEPSG
jgi:hypothetical protein